MISAIELASQDIRVNVICLGTVDTPINNHPGAEAELKFVKTVMPARRMGDASEVPALIHFLAADGPPNLRAWKVSICNLF